MTKYKFESFETKRVLGDLENRIQQLIEVNQLYKKGNEKLVEHQQRAFESVLTLIDQIKSSGKIERGSGAAPDSIEPLVSTKYQPPLA